jgi:hypothetical protein
MNIINTESRLNLYQTAIANNDSVLLSYIVTQKDEFNNILNAENRQILIDKYLRNQVVYNIVYIYDFVIILSYVYNL